MDEESLKAERDCQPGRAEEKAALEALNDKLDDLLR